MKLAYIVSRFPKLSETFVVSEMIEQIALGADIEIYPLQRHREGVVQGDVVQVMPRVHFSALFSWKVVKANLLCVVHQPRQYCRVWWEVLSGTRSSPRSFTGALLFFPKSVLTAEQVKAAGIEHIHAHFATHPALAALIIHYLTGIPFSFTAHGSDIYRDQSMLRNKLDACAFVVAISDYNRRFMMQKCGADIGEKIRVVHCGVEPGDFDCPRTQAKDRVRITCLGRIQKFKGHRWLVEACALLRERGVAFECNIVGDGPERARLESQIARLKLNEVVHLHGACNHTRVRELLAQSDIVVLASVPLPNGASEGIPVALMEGMAAGLPVISTNISGIPELIEHSKTGLLVPPRDPVALADAIRTLCLDSDARARLGEAGRAKVLSDFNLHVSAQQLSQLFSRALEARPQSYTMAAD